MIASLIHPDGFLIALSGELKSDPSSIAALAHAVHAAGNELAVRVGTAPTQCITLHGKERSLTLLPTPQGVVMLEHEKGESLDSIQAQVTQLLKVPVVTQPAAPSAASISLADALYAAAP